MIKIPFVDLFAQYQSIKPEIDFAIENVIRESAFIRGKNVDNFENQFASLLGVKHCVSCANGTDALYIVMKGLNLKPGDEVITTAHSWISTSEAISQVGAKVVFCDTDSKSFTIDPDQIKAKISNRTVGIIPVHLYGQPADMDPIMKIAKENNLWVIEDCAQAHLAKYKNKVVGTFGIASTFSFYPGKNLGAMGDAGAIVTNDDKLAKWFSLFARHGGKGEHFLEGINSRLDGLQAAILSVKLPYLKDWTEKRIEIAKMYNNLLGGINEIEIPQVSEGRTHVYHLYVIRASYRDELRNFLLQSGIETMLNYPKALPFYPAYGYLNHTPYDFPNAFFSQESIISLPIYPELNIDQIQYICICIKKFYDLKNI
jgi:dTDP-4-amino-4,6-dideoxygalactose transaminase